ncbi:hypothetical protein L3X38_027823 [Prunus dulcis]|uniref:Reverse transcriptase zinc-binding domain-containing protein n=1 Tax=Prunus dulcis TaxID=3755 RepID=A0AAD4VQX5_PRUDU|nr:hypothetical protein L3X38_027823 [Prunus dulcis]
MSIDQRAWKLIWHADVTSKIRHFFWRALNRHVAVSSVLYKKKLRNFPLCPICNDHEETIEHMLLLCPWVEPVWFTGLTYRVDRQQISSLHTWLRDCTRNKVVFDNFTPQPQQTLKAIFDQVNERFSLKYLITSSTTRSVHPSAQASWAGPSEPFVKINVDAAWRKSTCHAGASIVIRNFEGRFLGAKAVDFQVENALIAEATRLWEGCKFAKERGHNMVCFESDSLELIQSVRGSFGRGSWTLYQILTLIRNEQRYVEECRWNWTSRNCNQAANHLTSLALSRSTEVWVERPPTSLVHILCKDGLPCPHHA